MDRCPLCGGSDCQCVLRDTVAYVRALIRAELEHLAANRAALLDRVETANGRTPEETERMNGIIHRLWIRFLALEDLDEDFERAVFRAHQATRVNEQAELSIEQRHATDRGA